MDKQDNSMSNYNHGINLFERKSLVITGVKKIENFIKVVQGDNLGTTITKE